ncbi:cob(I)yrinic acid a,c-diamide adenosyltransferase [Qipengyuania atrilutea]|uniref:Corrinoid adenosyltransferase n=1 Tax=Qipengyuania atrilutea TaxID=2744473 RepID=A0A850H696_9SPHN|nr:cob(I)yrinic acid a,c-diamide adenosyltransferase [Actirhodobacter atriluteus]NVD44685.1 cob(I)yrinic acid a,c-diamide adenosyltransferase [Actirhodobacter atriluteus]
MVKLNKIYTRTGDDGTTGLVDGSRTAKHAPRMEAIGAVDEANSAVGFAASVLDDGDLADALFRVQNDLFDLGADIATPAPDGDYAPSEMVLRVVQSQTDWLERAIDALNEGLEPLTSFVLPGGTEASSRLHLARASTRRAERAMTECASEEPLNPAALSYINRLSDYLFVAARAANGDKGDVKWVPGANR